MSFLVGLVELVEYWTAKDQKELGERVELVLRAYGELERSYGETFLETANRVRGYAPRLAQFLEWAEKFWSELSN